MTADWTSAEIVMASLLGAFALGTLSDRPAIALARLFAYVARALRRRAR
jgi:hypothetical protein